jgi:hypothetical protein
MPAKAAPVGRGIGEPAPAAEIWAEELVTFLQLSKLLCIFGRF